DGEKIVVEAHVEERHLNDDRIEKVRPLRERNADEQPAIAATHDAEVLRARDTAADEVPRNRDDVVIDELAILLEAGPVPSRPELAAAADVRDHVDAAALQPGSAGHGRVPRRHRDLEPAVRVQ